jgi:hypothetical protein
MAQSTDKVTLALVTADGFTNVTADLANIAATTQAAPPPHPPTTGLVLLPVGVTPKIIARCAVGLDGGHDAATNGTATGVTTYRVRIGAGRPEHSRAITRTTAGRAIKSITTDTTAKNFWPAIFGWMTRRRFAQMELYNNLAH